MVSMAKKKMMTRLEVAAAEVRRLRQEDKANIDEMESRRVAVEIGESLYEEARKRVSAGAEAYIAARNHLLDIAESGE